MKAVKEYLGSLFRLKMPEQIIMKQIYDESQQSLNNSYRNAHFRKFILSVPVKNILEKAVEIFIGSQSSPRNQQVALLLVNEAKNKAKTDEQRNLADYYKTYLNRMQAMQTGNQQLFQQSSEMLLELAEKGQPQANYFVAKQIMKIIENTPDSVEKQKLIEQNIQKFSESICDSQYQGIYYLSALIKQIPKKTRIIKDEEIKDMLLLSAALGNNLALFQLALIMKKQNKKQLFGQYLRQAAENGVIQAQHNLAVCYLLGQDLQKDELKALSWFMNASAHNFIYSKYNAAMLLWKGSSCGRIKPNLKAALVYLQEIQKSKEIDVSDKIKQIIESKNKQLEAKLNEIN